MVTGTRRQKKCAGVSCGTEVGVARHAVNAVRARRDGAAVISGAWDGAAGRCAAAPTAKIPVLRIRVTLLNSDSTEGPVDHSSDW